MDTMAKFFDCVVELKQSEAAIFLEDWLNPKPNPSRDAAIKRAKNLNIEVRY